MANIKEANWKKDPSLSGISAEKLNLLTEILSQSESLNANALIPFFLSAASNAGKKGISFSDDETDTILNVLKINMSPAEIQKIETIRKMSHMISKKQTNS